MSRTVHMEVICMGPECKSCPELELDIERCNIYKQAIENPIFTNVIFCKHYRKCEQIAKNIRKICNSDNEKDGV